MPAATAEAVVVRAPEPAAAALQVRSLDIPEVKLLMPRVFRDARGHFVETWSRRTLAAAGIEADFVQDNQSLSRDPGVVRGLHYQVAPHAQAKLVRVVRGAILDVAVDIRRGSPTYGRHVSAVLSAETMAQLWVPVGFAHGFATLKPDTEVAYKVTAGYAPDCDRGLAWDDPDLAIDWSVSARDAILSPKDRRHPRLKDLGPDFAYEPA